MATNQFLLSLKGGKLPPSVGNKAHNLRRLMDKGFSIPVTFVCDWRAYHLYLQKDAGLPAMLRQELQRSMDPGKAYAIRSSANIEDSLDWSFAGQFKSVLNVQGVDQIMQAIWSIWEAAIAPGVQAYLERHAIPAREISMAAIVQEMVPAVASGVALSRNPVTGADEVIVEAVHGCGDALVQDGVSPCRWVNKWGNWLTKSEDDTIPLSLVGQVVEQTRKISKALKTPIDLEWAWDGKTITWLQARAITALPHHNVYSNAMSKEMLPGMIKPLIWSVNIPMKSTVFVKFINEALGETGIQAEELIKSFYYRVYFNMGVLGQAFKTLGLPDESLEMMMGLQPMGRKMVKPTPRMVTHLPRMMSFAHVQMNFHKKVPKILPDLERRIKSIRWQEAGRLDEQDLLAETDQLYRLVQEVTYYNILCPILSVMHTQMLNGELKRLGLDISQFDMTEGLPEAIEYDPATHLRRLHAAFENLTSEQQEAIRKGKTANLIQLEGAQEFLAGVMAFIDRFGHLSDNGNDFSHTPWRESPDMVLDLILDFKAVPEEKTAKVRFADLKVSFLRRPMIRIFYERVRAYRLLREQLSVYYTYTYGLFRYYYLAMGENLVTRNVIDTPADVFYLADRDVRQLLTGQAQGSDIRAAIAQHKANIEKFRDISLPNVIYGDEEPPLIERNAARLYGLTTSFGCYSGPVKVVKGLSDFGKLMQGDVLVIPYSDVGWSPLFALAGAVVAESGGMLSHSSIIAREYGIPAVVSVNGAMDLRDNMHVTVDGHKGEVIIHPAPVFA
jgi:phosphoenolpyruvate synthase/pyruvate phosphate dikinase